MVDAPNGAIGGDMTSAALLVLAIAGLLRIARSLRERRERAHDELAVETAIVPAVDLLRLAVSAGLAAHGAVMILAEHAPAPLRPGLDEVLRRVSLGDRLGDALDALDTWGEPGRPLVAVLRTAAFDGVALSMPLERVAADVRDQRRRRAEARARRLPVQLLFPLAVCVLPAFVLLAVVPVLVSSWPAGH